MIKIEIQQFLLVLEPKPLKIALSPKINLGLHKNLRILIETPITIRICIQIEINYYQI